VSPPAALAFALATGLFATLVATWAGSSVGGLMTLGLACGWAYDLRLSGTPLSFLPFVAGIVTVPWVGTAAVGARPRRALLMSVIAGLLGLGLHLANGGPDAGRDRQAGRRSLPALLGGDRSRVLTHTILTAAALLVVSSSPSGQRRKPWLSAMACLGILALDRHHDRTQRAPGEHPFVLPVLAAGVLAAGWLAVMQPSGSDQG
jgi:4-hydroxybenzoate polyprenyltransferase